MLVANTNNYPEIHPYLCCEPFTLYNVNVALILPEMTNDRLYAMSVHGDKIKYFYEDPNHPPHTIVERQS